MEFVIAPDGTLLASWEWANPDELKQFLEEKVGPSGISDEEWQELSKRRRSMTSLQNNDEVPGTQVPKSSLFPLKVERIAEEGEENPPFTLEAGTLPPEITPGGQSRLYLTIRPDDENDAYFDNAEAAFILLSEAKGIELKKEKLVAGKRRRDKDIYPHSLGAVWSRDKDAEDLEFTATVAAKMGKGEEPLLLWRGKYRVSGAIPIISQTTDEVLISQIPPRVQLKTLQCVASEKEPAAPFMMEALLHRDSSDPEQGTAYLFLKVDIAGGYKWNNLASPAQIKVKPISGAKFGKNTLSAGKREGDDDTEDRILALKLTLDPGAEEISFEVATETWICNANQGWCRQFATTHQVTGKL